jgi:hypothetical protein
VRWSRQAARCQCAADINDGRQINDDTLVNIDDQVNFE